MQLLQNAKYHETDVNITFMGKLQACIITLIMFKLLMDLGLSNGWVL